MLPGYLLGLDLSAKTTVLAEIFLLDPESRAKAGARAGSRRRRTTNNMTTGVQSSIQRLDLFLRIFGYGGGISMVIGSDHREGSEAMEETETSI